MFDVIGFCLGLWSLSGVFCNTLFMKVYEGESVTLPMSVNETQRKQGITWKYGAQGFLIAEIIRGNCKDMIYDDQANGIFRGKLELDNQSGSLTITNITANHSGLYEVSNTSTKAKLKTFNITVNDYLPGQGIYELVLNPVTIGCAVGVIIIIALFIVICICICRKRRKRPGIYQQDIYSGEELYTGIK